MRFLQDSGEAYCSSYIRKDVYMRFIADFHIHSHFSIATSKKLMPEYLDYWAKIKGIQVVGVGDCVHPGWWDELQEKLEPAGNGLYRLKKEYGLAAPLPKGVEGQDVYFLLTTEISGIYKKHGKVRKVHSVCVFPDLDVVSRMQSKLEKIGNIRSDGRPILGLDAKDLLEMVLESNSHSYLIPAHIWTPWFSVLGAKSGYDSIEECFEELTPHIFALETGLSSDPPMNRLCSFLDRFRLVSNSDAHSPEKLGREANIFDTDLSYQGILDSLKYDHGFEGTIEFFPQEGKYHCAGHRKCQVCLSLEDVRTHGVICSVCGKPLTAGVCDRVAELADRITPIETKQKFYSITALPSLIAEMLGVKNSASKKVQKRYFEMLEGLGTEFDILLFKPLDELAAVGGELFARGVERLRTGDVQITDGYDGEFGKIRVFSDEELRHL